MLRFLSGVAVVAAGGTVAAVALSHALRPGDVLAAILAMLAVLLLLALVGLLSTATRGIGHDWRLRGQVVGLTAGVLSFLGGVFALIARQ